MIDINLRKALTKPGSGSGYELRPTLRLIDQTETGKISGMVDASLLPGQTPHCAVYVYSGSDIIPYDYHDSDNILTSTTVEYDTNSTSYRYTAAYLPVGNYTVSLTCNVDDPDLNQNNAPSNLDGNDVIFTDGITESVGKNTEVVLNGTATVNFAPQP